MFGIGSALLIIAYILNWQFIGNEKKLEVANRELSRYEDQFDQDLYNYNQFKNEETKYLNQYTDFEKTGDSIYLERAVIVLKHMMINLVPIGKSPKNYTEKWNKMTYEELCKEMGYILKDNVECGNILRSNISIRKKTIIKLLDSKTTWSNRSGVIQLLGLILVLIANVIMMRKTD